MENGDGSATRRTGARGEFAMESATDATSDSDDINDLTANAQMDSGGPNGFVAEGLDGAADAVIDVAESPAAPQKPGESEGKVTEPIDATGERP